MKKFLIGLVLASAGIVSPMAQTAKVAEPWIIVGQEKQITWSYRHVKPLDKPGIYAFEMQVNYAPPGFEHEGKTVMRTVALVVASCRTQGTAFVADRHFDAEGKMLFENIFDREVVVAHPESVTASIMAKFCPKPLKNII